MELNINFLRLYGQSNGQVQLLPLRLFTGSWNRASLYNCSERNPNPQPDFGGEEVRKFHLLVGSHLALRDSFVGDLETTFSGGDGTNCGGFRFWPHLNRWWQWQMGGDSDGPHLTLQSASFYFALELPHGLFFQFPLRIIYAAQREMLN